MKEVNFYSVFISITPSQSCILNLKTKDTNFCNLVSLLQSVILSTYNLTITVLNTACVNLVYAHSSQMG